MSINRLTGYKRQELLQPGIDNNNFVRFQDLNNVIDDVNNEFTEVVSTIPAAKQRICSDGISSFTALASGSESSEVISPEDYDATATAMARAKFSFSGTIVFAQLDSLNSSAVVQRNGVTVTGGVIVRFGSNNTDAEASSDIQVPFIICAIINDLLPDDEITVLFNNASATKPLVVQCTTFDIEEL